MDKDVEELLSRGVAEGVGVEDLKTRILKGDKLRVKLGIDPTSPSIHIGHAVSLLKLRDFQKAGHKAVLIVGDFTALIGDTSDKDSERPMLSEETVEENKKNYFAQIGKLIDLESAELRYNSEWLKDLQYKDIGEQADEFSVADFIARDNIKRRLDAGKRVSLREVLYPLMQGYDSVAVKADVELGGLDQWFNLLAGRTLQARYGQKPQAILTTPLIPGLDGRKMSKSYGNAITLDDTAADMYGKIMSLADEHVSTYFEYCTRMPSEEIASIVNGHPKAAKMRLASEIVKLYHGESAAKSAEENFTTAFSKGGVPDDILSVNASKESSLAEILVNHGVVASKSEFNRLNDDGAIKEIEPGVYRIGKHRFIKISWQ